MAEARYIVGIDLGTSNTAVAYAPVKGGPVEGFATDQLVAPGEIERRATLPSVIYLPSEHEFKPGALALPFDEAPESVVGALARSHGARVPGRLITSAKSWLCHPAVDRESAILPPGGPREVPRMSPVDASARILSHVVRAWDYHFADAPLADQHVVLAVPASFDVVARKLTLRAAAAAGLSEHLSLIEEPQAAFYDFFSAREEALADEARPRLVLVVDVGGGTTDLTLIEARWTDDGAPALNRVAVGDHILLGGDNMDMAVARLAEQRMKVPGGRLDPARWALLTQSCRMAKEAILGDLEPHAENSVSSWKLSVPGRGSRLIGGALKCELQADEIRALVLDGFMPRAGAHDVPRRRVRTGLAQLGLPYEDDAALTRHVAAFLARHDAYPTSVLLNGGVFQSAVLQARLIEVIEGWGGPVELLEHSALDRAVARGATVFGQVQQGRGARIGGGSPRAYYVEVAGDATRKRPALCLIPRGQATGEVVELDQSFQLRVGRPVQFTLWATTDDREEQAGELIDLSDGDFTALPPVQAVLPHRAGDDQSIPVHLTAQLTELGSLDVGCLAVSGGDAAGPGGRWKLEFALRGRGRTHENDGPPDGEGVAKGLTEAQRQGVTELVSLVFGKAARPVTAKEVRQIRSALRQAMNARRETWTLPMLREMWELLGPGIKKRRRSADHEQVFFNQAGWFLRPGFGFPSDQWRMNRLWSLWDAGVEYHTDKNVWHAWWVMWRRVAGGLDKSRQQTLAREIIRWLAPTEAQIEADRKRKKMRTPSGHEEMLRLLASLERLEPAIKADWGAHCLERMEQGDDRRSLGWCLARFGARVPFTGEVHNVVDPELAGEWVDRLLRLSWKKLPTAAFATAHIARKTEDRLRDVDGTVAHRAAQKLTEAKQPELARMVREVVMLDVSDEGTFVGDALPLGLLLDG